MQILPHLSSAPTRIVVEHDNSRPRSNVTGTQAERATARVLIVDDETHNRSLLEIMLSSEGYELLTAASGEEALTVVEEQHPDLILLDIMMPEMNGFQVTTILKANPETEHIPIIILSAIDDVGARKRGLEVGAVAFLTKPIHHVELRALIRKLLRG